MPASGITRGPTLALTLNGQAVGLDALDSIRLPSVLPSVAPVMK
jgi:hypothetical protein